MENNQGKSEEIEFPGMDEQIQPKRMLSKEWKRQLWRLLWLLLFPLAFGLKEWAASNPDIIESAFAGKLYPTLSSIVGAIFGWMPFSFVEFLIYGLIAALLTWIIWTIVKAAKKNMRAIRLVRTLITFGLIGGIGMNLFYVMWGFNYFRYPLSYTMNLDVRERGPQELADLCVLLAYQANALREQVPEDNQGVFTYGQDYSLVFEEIPKAYENLAEDYPQFERMWQIPTPKPVAASELMSYAGISGIYIPFTEESNVNVHQPALLIASTAGHESAHFMGIAREDEANFLGYLACMYSEDVSVQYSGTVLALIQAGNALNDISSSAYSKLHSYYSDGLNRDLDTHREYWDSYEGEVEQMVTEMNDTYLKQHKQSDGVRSYGRMVDLLLAYYEDVLAQ